jgi:hypothetical protein
MSFFSIRSACLALYRTFAPALLLSTVYVGDEYTMGMSG